MQGEGGRVWEGGGGVCAGGGGGVCKVGVGKEGWHRRKKVGRQHQRVVPGGGWWGGGGSKCYITTRPHPPGQAVRVCPELRQVTGRRERRREFCVGGGAGFWPSLPACLLTPCLFHASHAAMAIVAVQVL